MPDPLRGEEVKAFIRLREQVEASSAILLVLSPPPRAGSRPSRCRASMPSWMISHALPR
ncbi:hypothetical protein ACFSYD_24650 [Paracoccus aerius]